MLEPMHCIVAIVVGGGMSRGSPSVCCNGAGSVADEEHWMKGALRGLTFEGITFLSEGGGTLNPLYLLHLVLRLKRVVSMCYCSF